MPQAVSDLCTRLKPVCKQPSRAISKGPVNRKVFMNLPQYFCHKNQMYNGWLCKIFLKHQNFNMTLQISSDKKNFLFRSHSHNQLVMLLYCRLVGQTPRQTLEAGPLSSVQSQQVTPMASLSHLQSQGHTQHCLPPLKALLNRQINDVRSLLIYDLV